MRIVCYLFTEWSTGKAIASRGRTESARRIASNCAEVRAMANDAIAHASHVTPKADLGHVDHARCAQQPTEREATSLR